MGKIEAILIAGPTASGKSRLAMELAEQHGGVVINADSMQVYDALPILTARPKEEDLARVPHRLYGHVPPEQSYSVGSFVRDAEHVLDELRRDERLPIFCGGTGLYFKALAGLLDAMPAIPGEIRQHWRLLLSREGAETLHAVLAERDPPTAERLHPSDGQRIVRALEIGEATGVPLSRVQAGEGRALLDPKRCRKLVLTPDRDLLRARIAARFTQMVEIGVVDEVAVFRSRPRAMQGLAAKAIGVEEIGRMLDGEINLSVACEKSIVRTRQYAKRQETFFRNQFDGSWERVPV